MIKNDKMKRNTNIWVIILLILTIVSAEGQTLKIAEQYYSGGAYFSAAKQYRDLLNLRNKDKELRAKRGEILFKVGECYRKMNRTDEAFKWYTQAQSAGYTESDLYYGLGNIQLVEGNYAEAKQSFQMAKDKNPGDRRIESKLSSCDLYEVYGQENNQYNIKPLDNLNTRGSEYGLSFFGDRLIFASTGVNSSRKEMSERTGLPYSELYVASPDTRTLYGRVKKLEGLSGDRSNEGSFCYDLQTNQLYCTRCESNDRGCYIIKIDIKDDEKYRESGKLRLGEMLYGIGHPYITEDGKRIYFTSVMAGGFGGADLWYVDRDFNGDYGHPVNLGENINTPGDEVFPSYIDGVLYFSSDGHPGMGGLDLFASYMEDDGSFSKPFNMRSPFNSSWDDFNLIHRPGSNMGLFVSNRNNKESSDDIYSFDNFPPKMIVFSGQVYDKETSAVMKDYTVIISEGGKEIYRQKVSGDSGYFMYMEPNRRYDIRVSSTDYVSSTQLVSTEGIKNFSDMSVSTYLSKEPDLDTGDTATVLQIVMKDIFYEFNKFRLTESSKRELDRFLDYFKTYPNMVVEISAHTDSRGNNSYNFQLSKFRAQAVVNYLVSKGVNSSQLIGRGYGEEDLLVPNARTEAEHQANRRTVFRILRLGSGSANVEIKHMSAMEMLNSAEGIVDMSGWWLVVHESNNYREMELPVVRQAEVYTGREVRMIRCDDGKYRYCIQYSTRTEALQAQLSLLNDKINSVLIRF
jgi:peptidoglycan-associated lipoprotein